METYNHYLQEAEADRLLAAITRGACPHYRDERIDRKVLRDKRRASEVAAIAPEPCEAAAIIRRRTIRRVLRAAKLTRRQLEVFTAKLAGHGWLEIGSRFGYSRQAAQGIFKQALGKFTRAWAACPLVGLEDVYRQEVSRFSHRRR